MQNQNLDVDSVKEIMLEYFVPIIRTMLMTHNPEKWKEWGGNCCKQTAIVGCSILTGLLPDWTWNAWDGEFDDVIEGNEVNYNHAWILGKSPDGQRYLVDLARTSKPLLFIPVSKNAYSSEWTGYEKMILKTRTPIDWREMLKVQEYFTGFSGQEVADRVLETMIIVLAKGVGNVKEENSNIVQ